MSTATDAFRRWAKDKPLTDILKRSHGDTFMAGWEEGEAERKRLRSALVELVALKDLKDTEGRTAAYEQRQPLAWQAAREALGESD